MRAEVFWIAGRWPGRVGIVPRPRGGDWLDDELRAWRAAGVDIVVSLLTPAEVKELELEEEPALSRKHGMQFRPFPVPDRGVPESNDAVTALVSDLARSLRGGKGVAVHCRQSIGRSAVLAALLLAYSGQDPDDAFAAIEKARGRAVPDTIEQRAWVKASAHRLHEPARRPRPGPRKRERVPAAPAWAATATRPALPKTR